MLTFLLSSGARWKRPFSVVFPFFFLYHFKNGRTCSNLKHVISLCTCLRFNLTMSEKSDVKILIFCCWNVYISRLKVFYCAFFNMNVVTKGTIYYYSECVCRFFIHHNQQIQRHLENIPMFILKVRTDILQSRYAVNQRTAWWMGPKRPRMSLV